jgi:hypothetical protein
MIRSCLLSRQELANLIKSSPRTHDKYYFFPRFRDLLLLQGPLKDIDFIYDRKIFENKICFSDYDIRAFLSTKDTKYDIDLSRFIDTKIQETLKDFLKLNLDDIIPGKTYTLNELIDTTIYFIKYKYS